MLSSLAYSRAGRGEPLILIHGIGHRRQAWSPVFGRLAEHFDVIALDLPGFGESPPLNDAPTTMEYVLEALRENFDAWGVERPHVVGNSLGGAIALHLGDRGLARSVVALSPGGFFGLGGVLRAMAVLLILKLGSHAPRRLLRMLAESRLGHRLSGAPLYADPALYSPRNAMAMRRGKAFWPTYRQILRFRYRGGAPAPTAIAWGTRDWLLGPRQAERARTALPNAAHLAIDGAGHVPMGDRPDAVVRIILQTAAQAR